MHKRECTKKEGFQCIKGRITQQKRTHHRYFFPHPRMHVNSINFLDHLEWFLLSTPFNIHFFNFNTQRHFLSLILIQLYSL